MWVSFIANAFRIIARLEHFARAIFVAIVLKFPHFTVKKRFSMIFDRIIG